MAGQRVPVRAAVAAVVVVSLLVPAASGGSEAERMQLACDSGLVIERANGSSWWGVGPDGTRDGTVYTTRSVTVTDAGGGVVYAHDYGQKGRGAGSTTCTAEHFGWTWTVELVRAT